MVEARDIAFSGHGKGHTHTYTYIDIPQPTFGLSDKWSVRFTSC